MRVSNVPAGRSVVPRNKDTPFHFGRPSCGYVPAPFDKVTKEKLDSYEIGLKTSFRGAVSGYFNVAGFYNELSNAQISVGLQSSTNAATPTQAIVNAGSARIWGIEVESSISPFQGFDLTGSFTYLNTEVTAIGTPTGTPPYDIVVPTVTLGSSLPDTPKYKASVTASYTLPLPETVGKVSVGATYTYIDSTIINTTTMLPSIETLNLNLNWNSVLESPIDLSLFVTNATNEKYYLSINNQTAQGFVTKFPAEPRMYGVRLRYSFGR